MGPPRRPRGFRPLRRTVWDDWGVRAVRGAGVSLAAASGSFARCDGREFRPLWRAGISPRARGDRGRCPLDPAIWVACRPLARVVGEEFFVRARCGFAAILDVWQEAAPPPWRKRPGEHRRHTGGGQPSQEKIQ